MSEFDPYAELQIERGATDEQIKSAYRKRSKETHADATGDGDNTAFIAATRAYRILTDPKRRKAYDEHGDADFDVSKDREAIVDLIGKTFDAVIADAMEEGIPLKNAPILELMINRIKQGIRSIRTDYDNQKEVADQLKEVRSRLSRDDDDENVFSAIIDKRVIDIEKVQTERSKALRQLSDVALELDRYRNDVEVMQSMQAGFSTSNSTGYFTMQDWANVTSR